MPQFKPDFVRIPREIKENPEKFGLTERELSEVENCNSVAEVSKMNAMLTDEQWEDYWKAVKVIKAKEFEIEFEKDWRANKKRLGI